VARAVCETVNRSGIETVIYISCNPATLARDLGLLKNAYEIKAAAAFDMFPQTANVETVVVLKRKN
jgi:tRNA/tmRNA/rRNA uracil-C5-methylase (TrmA/RlmC/RlmD family)